MLAGEGSSTNAVFNELDKSFGVEVVVIEKREPFRVFLKRRVKKLGIIKVLGQILFKVYESSVLNLVSKRRQEQIINNGLINFEKIPTEKMIKVNSINSDEVVELIKLQSPDLIVINGTRIISKKVLKSIDCKFINIHAGITPKYRGVHGGYWALVNNDLDNCGVTVHYVNEGIDTGDILAQENIQVTQGDNFTTLPLLQLELGIQLLGDIVSRILNEERIQATVGVGESKLYFHPSLWEYFYYRFVRNVK